MSPSVSFSAAGSVLVWAGVVLVGDEGLCVVCVVVECGETAVSESSSVDVSWWYLGIASEAESDDGEHETETSGKDGCAVESAHEVCIGWSAEAETEDVDGDDRRGLRRLRMMWDLLSGLLLCRAWLGMWLTVVVMGLMLSLVVRLRFMMWWRLILGRWDLMVRWLLAVGVRLVLVLWRRRRLCVCVGMISRLVLMLVLMIIRLSFLSLRSRLRGRVCRLGVVLVTLCCVLSVVCRRLMLMFGVLVRLVTCRCRLCRSLVLRFIRLIMWVGLLVAVSLVSMLMRVVLILI